MDLAITIFWVGVGAGALLVGIGVMMVAFSLRPVARDVRALANDARRLSRLAESELTTLTGRARELTEGAEVLSADLAVQLDALKAQTEELEQRVLGEPAAGELMADEPMAAEPVVDEPMSSQPIASFGEHQAAAEAMAVGEPAAYDDRPPPDATAYDARPQPAEPGFYDERPEPSEPVSYGQPMEQSDSMRRQPIGSVQSPHAREDDHIA